MGGSTVYLVELCGKHQQYSGIQQYSRPHTTLCDVDPTLSHSPLP